MLNLDDSTRFAEIDSLNLLADIDALPTHLQSGWDLGQRLPLPAGEPVSQVVIAAMGHSAIACELFAAYAATVSKVPVYIHRDYDLPAWASGPHTLVAAVSHSGGTEETLSSYQRARQHGCQVLAITTGGQLGEATRDTAVPAWVYEHRGRPHAGIAFPFSLLLAAFARLSLLPNPQADLGGAITALQAQQASLKSDSRVGQNPAKRLAGQFYGRWAVVLGSGLLAPVARRWKSQLNEQAKAWAQADALPEADHNTLSGTMHPDDLLAKAMAIFLRAPSDHPRNQQRSDLTRQAFMLEGINTDYVDAQGDTPLAHQWTALHYGDYTAYYLAMLYGEDPSLNPVVEAFKQELGE